MTLDNTTISLPPRPQQPTGIVKEAINKETKDLYLAAAFHCEGCKLMDVNKTDRTRMVFIFEGGELADRVEKEWYQQTLLQVSPLYAASLRLMKSLIHSG